MSWLERQHCRVFDLFQREARLDAGDAVDASQEVLKKSFVRRNIGHDHSNEIVCVAATPVPLNATVVGELGALLTMFTVPARLAAVVGMKTALKVVLPPAATVLGTLSPFTV